MNSFRIQEWNMKRPDYVKSVNVDPETYDSIVEMAKLNNRTIGGQVQAFQLTNGSYPDTLDEVGYGAHRDPWGNPYQYLNFQDVKGKGKMRKDRFLVPINSFFDLYSMGKDGKSVSPLTAQQSQDDIIWANDGGYVGLGKDF